MPFWGGDFAGSSVNEPLSGQTRQQCAMLAGGWNAGDKVVKVADEAIWNLAKGYVGGADEGRVSPPPPPQPPPIPLPPFGCVPPYFLVRPHCRAGGAKYVHTPTVAWETFRATQSLKEACFVCRSSEYSTASKRLLASIFLQACVGFQASVCCLACTVHASTAAIPAWDRCRVRVLGFRVSAIPWAGACLSMWVANQVLHSVACPPWPGPLRLVLHASDFLQALVSRPAVLARASAWIQANRMAMTVFACSACRNRWTHSSRAMLSGASCGGTTSTTAYSSTSTACGTGAAPCVASL